MFRLIKSWFTRTKSTELGIHSTSIDINIKDARIKSNRNNLRIERLIKCISVAKGKRKSNLEAELKRRIREGK